MTAEVIYCPSQTRAARMHEDPEPAEFCTNEVQDYGDLCGDHDADARMEDDYDRYLQSRDDS